MWLAYANSGPVEALGTWPDASGQGHDGTLVANAVVDVNGLDLGTTDAGNKCTANPGSQAQWTAAAWAYLTTSGPYAYRLFSGGSTSNLAVNISAGMGKYWGGSWVWQADLKPTLNGWAFYAWTYDGSLLRTYKNGVEAAATTTAGALNPTAIGYYEDGQFHRYLDDVWFFSRALSLPELDDVRANSPGKRA